MRRILALPLVITAAFALILPTPALASGPPPELSGFVPDWTKPIPFLSQGQSSTVGGVTVTAVTNSAVVGDTANTYLHRSLSEIRTVLTFDEPIPGFRVQTRAHADCPDSGCFEDYRFVGKDLSGAVVFDTSIRNSNQTTPFLPGSTSTSALIGLIATLEIDYTHDPQQNNFQRGSYVNLWLTDTYLTPATQSVTGSAGVSISATTAFSKTGFAGAVTYAVTNSALPAGLQLDPTTGVVSGTPTAGFAGSVTISATGASFGRATATINFDIEEPPPTVPVAPPVFVVLPPSTTTSPPVTTPPTTTTPEPVLAPEPITLPITGTDTRLRWFGAVALVVGASMTVVATRRRATH